MVKLNCDIIKTNMTPSHDLDNFNVSSRVDNALSYFDTEWNIKT